MQGDSIEIKLKAHAQEWEVKNIEQQWHIDANHPHRLKFDFDGTFIIDFSKNPVTSETIALLNAWATEKQVGSWRDKMFQGVHINTTEDRAVLHTLLRYEEAYPLPKGLEAPYAEIKETLKAMEKVTQDIRSKARKGYTGKAFKKIVHIGIGGSYLGVQMVYKALMHPDHQESIPCLFIANGDRQNSDAVLKECNPEETLVIVVSKTFSTQETIANAYNAKRWITAAMGEKAIGNHFIAISTAKEKCKAFGIKEDSIIGFWDFVGGRFSTWSAVGLSIAISLGWNVFKELLHGAALMDKHFLETPVEKNIPMQMALIAVWMRSFLKIKAHVVIPYDYYLGDFPAYLQQLEMESNGKSVDRKGNRVPYETTPVLFGQAGTDCQHSFFQLLHQGTDKTSIDFIGVVNPKHNDRASHDAFMANFFAQGEALLRGKSAALVEGEMKKNGKSMQEIERQKPFKVFEGNKGSTSMLVKRLDAKTLGMLMALYEHRTFVQSILWDIYAFDQFGVELGKEIAGQITQELMQKQIKETHDSSTQALINDYYKWQE